MTRPVNLFSISRMHDEVLFNIIETHQGQLEKRSRHKYHEIESLRLFVDSLIRENLAVEELDNFFFGFTIPQIGKEFDLLKFTEDQCLNIELKSESVSPERILDQLIRNQYYLRHLGKEVSCFSIVTNTMTCFRLIDRDEIKLVDFSEVVAEVVAQSEASLDHIDDLFRPSGYLVSPINTPERFILGEYFLTQSQEQIKKALLKRMEEVPDSAFFHITGKPGTGKTLLLYDIAKELSKRGETLIIHCGLLARGQMEIDSEIEDLYIVSASELRKNNFSLDKYAFVLVDESHRFYPGQFEYVCDMIVENGAICIFSSDPEQVLSATEKNNDIVGKINELELAGEYTLSEKMRMNPELNSFILQLFNLTHRPRIKMNYPNVDMNYANTTAEAQMLIEYYRKKGYNFINYSKSNRRPSPYKQYAEDYDTHHVIGQEFDKVLMLMDDSFYYDDEGLLHGIEHPNPDYLYPSLLYQGVTRVREKLAIIVVNAPELMDRVASIVNNE